MCQVVVLEQKRLQLVCLVHIAKFRYLVVAQVQDCEMWKPAEVQRKQSVQFIIGQLTSRQHKATTFISARGQIPATLLIPHAKKVLAACQSMRCKVTANYEVKNVDKLLPLQSTLHRLHE